VDGRIRELRVLDGHFMLTKAALEAVSRWVYKPTLLNGEPVEVVAPITVTFNLR
jgi:protein TonB